MDICGPTSSTWDAALLSYSSFVMQASLIIIQSIQAPVCMLLPLRFKSEVTLRKKKKSIYFLFLLFPSPISFFHFIFLFVGLMCWILNRKTSAYIIWGWEGAQVHIPGSEQNQTIYLKDFYSPLCSHTLFDSPIWHLKSAYVRTLLGAEMFSWLLHDVNFYHGFAQSCLVQKHFLSSSCFRSLSLSISLGFAFGAEVAQAL